MATYFYTTYEGSLITNTTFTCAAACGGPIYSGYVVNDSVTGANTFGVQFSSAIGGTGGSAGTTFGSTITLRGGDKLPIDGLNGVDQIKLIYGNANTAPYRVLVSVYKSNVQ